MPNQRAIATALGISQSTVSLALRNDPSIPKATCERVRQAAQRLGYRENTYLNSLMADIRNGKRRDECIAILVDAESMDDWQPGRRGVFWDFYQGSVQRAAELGLHTECFFLREKGLNAARINRILKTRGVRGLLLAAPDLSGQRLDEIDWNAFCPVAVSYSWSHLPIDRVASRHGQIVQKACETLAGRGYRRVGLCLPPGAIQSKGHFWLGPFLAWQYQAKNRLPVFAGTPDDTPLARFRAWLEEWKPDVLVTLAGTEKCWLDRLGLRVPQDLGLICLNRSGEFPVFTGMKENGTVVGASALELVVSRMVYNQRGLPAHPRLILIDGSWIEGDSIRPAHRDE